MTAKEVTIDPVTFSIVGKTLINIAQEMNFNLVRSAYSTIIREVRDASTGLLDANAETVTQSEAMPIHLNSISSVLRGCLEKHRIDDIRPDDVLIANDPYHGGQHLNDIFLYTPIFYKDKLIGFTSTVGHHLDVGGGGASSLNPDATDIYSEGFVIPRLRLKGKYDWNLFCEILKSNVRVPYKTMGDLRAQLAANKLGERRLVELIEKYGLSIVLACTEKLKNYSERRTRQEIAKIPDGTYSAEVPMDGSRKSRKRMLRIKVTIKVEGSNMVVDFSGTDSQVPEMINSPLVATEAAVYTATKCLLTGVSVPANEGCNKPINVVVPKGSLLNPFPPAPVRGRVNAANRALNAVIRAMADVLPKRIGASGFDTSLLLAFSYKSKEGTESIFTEPIRGGYGANYMDDGANQCGTPLDNCTNTPVEAVEQDYNFFRIRRYELVEDSAGIGRQCGSQGAIREFEILKDGVTLVFFGDRFLTSALGIFGGGDGVSGSLTVIRDAKTIQLPSRVRFELKRNDVVQVKIGGGGGYGDPKKRPKGKIERDLREGRISERMAKKMALHGLWCRKVSY